MSVFELLLFTFLWFAGAIIVNEGNAQTTKNSNNLEQLDSFFDPKVDYSRFIGRVTDKDDTSSILKVTSENSNVRFFRAGDKVEFTPGKGGAEKCIGYVRDTEKNYFVLYVKDLYPCWKNENYFRRGTLLNFYSEMLADRIKEAAQFRLLLISRRNDFLKQLNSINNFIWTYDQERVVVAAEFDKKINEINDEKQIALNDLTKKKEDQLRVQRELQVKLDELDSDLDHYRVDKIELYSDRWNLDHDVGVPVDNRPMEIKKN